MVISYVVTAFAGMCFCLLFDENRRLKAENKRWRRKAGHYEIYGHCQSGEKR
nr:MAG TPA: hypothetical protein [Caudoviricetes sp.]